MIPHLELPVKESRIKEHIRRSRIGGAALILLGAIYYGIMLTAENNAGAFFSLLAATIGYWALGAAMILQGDHLKRYHLVKEVRK